MSGRVSGDPEPRPPCGTLASMDSSANQNLEPRASGDRSAGYVVVARRYRPQTFEELIGQEHVARALSGAIAANRVGHAYLFTGARGVGKTSAARILAKALNCEQGPTATPCNRCDMCQSISAGNDVDVLEIDGASNRGIDEIRQLRQNVNIRPSRARYKIYIIDEVHMLTREAFNALLKTLEEPPEHVKFIFCTTEPTKIPITILSRCQRFDFAGIRQPSIVARLEQIVRAEGVEAEPEALAILARRAAGSMRDSQSLLEQLLSFGGSRITTADVHAMLGTAGEARLANLVTHLVERNAQAAIADLDAALVEGVDVGQLLDQMLGYFRDMMASAIGCPSDALLHSAPSEHARLAEMGKQLGLENILAITQIVDHTLARLRYSTQARTLAEMALVRIAALGDLQDLSQLIAELREGAPPGSAAERSPVAARTSARELAKKKDDLNGSSSGANPADPAPLPARPTVDLTESNASAVWQQALVSLSDLLADNAALGESVALAAPHRLVVGFRAKYNSCKMFCERPEHLARIEQALAELTGRSIQVEFVALEDVAPQPAAPRRPTVDRRRLAEHPMIRRAGELFDAQVIRIEEAGN